MDLIEKFEAPASQRGPDKICSNDKGITNRMIFLLTVVQDPKPAIFQVLQYMGLSKKAHLFHHNPDVINELGQNSEETNDDRTIRFEVLYQTDYQVDFFSRLENPLSSDGIYTQLPLELFVLETVSLSEVLSKIGGLWTAVSSFTFLIASLFLYKNMLQQQAVIIQKNQQIKMVSDSYLNSKTQHDHSCDVDCDHSTVKETDEILNNMKKRLNFVGLYELYDRVEQSELVEKQLQDDVALLKAQMKTLIEAKEGSIQDNSPG